MYEQRQTASARFLNPTVCEVSYDDEIERELAAYPRPRTGGLSPARCHAARDTPPLSYGDYDEYREYVRCIYRDSRPVSQLTYTPRNTPSTPFIGNPQTILTQPDAWEVVSRRERVRTAPCSASRRVATAGTMPSAVRSSPTVPNRVPTSHNINAETFRKPQWIPALNAWVPVTKQREKESSYISFVGAVNLLDRGIYHEEPNNLDDREPPQPCPRFMSHMTQSMPIGPVNAAKCVKRITSTRSPTVPRTPFTHRRREDLLPKSLTRPRQRFVGVRAPCCDDDQEVTEEEVHLVLPQSPPPSLQGSEQDTQDQQGSYRGSLGRQQDLADTDSLAQETGDLEDDGIFSMQSGVHGDVVNGGSGCAGAGAGVRTGVSDSEEVQVVMTGVNTDADGGMGVLSGRCGSVKGGSARSQTSLQFSPDPGQDRLGGETEWTGMEVEAGQVVSGGEGRADMHTGQTNHDGDVHKTGEEHCLTEEETLTDLKDVAESTGKSKDERMERRHSFFMAASVEAAEDSSDKAPKSIMKKTKAPPKRIMTPRVTIQTEAPCSMAQQTDIEVPTAVEDYPIEEDLASVSEVSTIEVPQPKLIVDHKGKKGRDLKSEHPCRLKSPKVAGVFSLRSPKPRDTTLQDELRRQQLAEERRAKAAQMYEKLRKKPTDRGEDTTEGRRDSRVQQDFKDYGFLSKYCIFNKDKLRMYRKAFDAVDEDKDGYLSGQEALMALKGVVYSGSLDDAEEYYVYRILELADYRLTDGADFKLFAVMSALSQRIASLDDFMKDLIRKVDFKSLEYKMFRLKQLFLCNVDPLSNRIPLEHLMLELQAGGVSLAHQAEVREELAHLDNLDLLDFLAYVPLFIMIHQSVVSNPFDNQWHK